jgi:hypothetical protein
MIPRGSLRQGWKSLRIQKPSMPPDERPLPFRLKERSQG